MDFTVNKPAKDFLKQKFQEWYPDQILKQLDSSPTTNRGPATHHVGAIN